MSGKSIVVPADDESVASMWKPLFFLIASESSGEMDDCPLLLPPLVLFTISPSKSGWLLLLLMPTPDTSVVDWPLVTVFSSLLPGPLLLPRVRAIMASTRFRLSCRSSSSRRKRSSFSLRSRSASSRALRSCCSFSARWRTSSSRRRRSSSSRRWVSSMALHEWNSLENIKYE